MTRRCPTCGTTLLASTVRCACGTVLPEARDAQSDPDRPQCARCGEALAPMEETCPACGARGFPALRPRRGPKSRGAPPAQERPGA